MLARAPPAGMAMLGWWLRKGGVVLLCGLRGKTRRGFEWERRTVLNASGGASNEEKAKMLSLTICFLLFNFTVIYIACFLHVYSVAALDWVGVRTCRCNDPRVYPAEPQPWS